MGLRWIALLTTVFLTPAVYSAELTLTLGGTPLGTGPAFEVLVGGNAVGSGVVDPIPSDGKGTEFAFDVGDDLLTPQAELRVNLTNDAFEAGVGDRNLYVLGAALAGHQLKASDFQVMREGETIAKDGRLYRGTDFAVAAAPQGGWLPGSGGGETVALSPAPAASQCTAETTVTGFSNGVTAVSAEQGRQLQALVDQAATGDCKAVITGYSSSSGPSALNLQISEIRANAVRDFLTQQKASFSSVEVVGAGETNVFGVAGQNRRVVVKLTN